MLAKQLSVFLENKSGRLTEVTDVLGEAGVNLSAMSIADNSDFGILRCYVFVCQWRCGSCYHSSYRPGELRANPGREEGRADGCQRFIPLIANFY